MTCNIRCWLTPLLLKLCSRQIVPCWHPIKRLLVDVPVDVLAADVHCMKALQVAKNWRHDHLHSQDASIFEHCIMWRCTRCTMQMAQINSFNSAILLQSFRSVKGCDAEYSITLGLSIRLPRLVHSHFSECRHWEVGDFQSRWRQTILIDFQWISDTRASLLASLLT